MPISGNRFAVPPAHFGIPSSQDALKVADCYFSEGPKVLLRFAIALLVLVCQRDKAKFSDGS